MRADEFLTEAGQPPIYYFAYGMLTDPEIMQSAEFIGAAKLPNFSFEFCGYANVFPNRDSVSGVLWNVSREFLADLDRTEGYPHMYDRKTVPVMANGQRYEAFVYTMTPETRDRLWGAVPSQRYLQRLVNGYNHAGLSLQQIKAALTDLENIEDELSEARMSPSAFEKAIATGTEQGVLVGFEFEVCMPDEVATKGVAGAPTELNPASQGHSAEQTVERIMDDGSFSIHLGRGALTFDKFDQMFKAKPNSPYQTSQQAYTELSKNALATGMELFNEIPVRYRERFVQQSYQRALSEYPRADATKKRLMFLDILARYILYTVRRNAVASKVAQKIREVVNHGFEDWSNLIAAWIGLPQGRSLYANESESARKFLNTFEFDPNVVWAEFDLDDDYDYDEDIEYRKGVEKFAPALQQTMGMPVTIFNSYHEEKKLTDRWYIEPDSSLEPEEGDSAFEVVSPPLPAAEAMSSLNKFYQLAQQWQLYTSTKNDTGLHINVSIPSDLDVLKLAVFVGDQHVLGEFGRLESGYARSVSRDLAQRTAQREFNITRPTGQKALQNIVTELSRQHTASVNFNGKYVSFRHAGGDYLSNYQGIVNTVGRFVRAMQIASDPTAYREEYLTKLARLTADRTRPTGQFNKKFRPNPMLATISFVKQRGIPALKLSVLATDNKPEQTAKKFIDQLTRANQLQGGLGQWQIVQTIANSEDARRTMLPKYQFQTGRETATNAATNQFITVILALKPEMLDPNYDNLEHNSLNHILSIRNYNGIIRGYGTIDASFIPLSDSLGRPYLLYLQQEIQKAISKTKGRKRK